MRYAQLVDAFAWDPVFETTLLTAGNVTPYQAQRRLSGWCADEKVTRLRRGLYVLPKALRMMEPHPFVIANKLVAGSYISLEMALSYYSLIPEHVAIVTSVTTGRPGSWQNEFGRFHYRHIHPRYFFGIEYRLITGMQHAYIAYPEKALLDLIYLRKGGDSVKFIESLRLQNLEELDIRRLWQYAKRFGKPKLQRAAAIISQLAEREAAEYEML